MARTGAYKQPKRLALHMIKTKWGTCYLFIADFFATLNIGGAKELVVLLSLSDINNELKE